MVDQFANSGDPDQMPHSAASDLGLHCLPIIFLRVSRLQSVNKCFKKFERQSCKTETLYPVLVWRPPKG